MTPDKDVAVPYQSEISAAGSTVRRTMDPTALKGSYLLKNRKLACKLCIEYYARNSGE